MKIELSESAKTERRVPAAGKRAPDSGWRPLRRLTFAVLVLILGMTVIGNGAAPTLLPNNLSGVWRTSAENYANCYMEFTPVTIIFGTAEGGYTLYFVTRVEETKGPGETAYVIDYKDLANESYQMSLHYKPGPDAILYLKNQPKVVWKKRPSA